MSTTTGVGRITRFVLRRDRLRIPVWLLAVGGMTIVSAASLPPVYPDQQKIDMYAQLFGDNPALIAFAGPGYGFDNPNIGVILVNETQLWVAIAVALMSIFLLNRHTRAEEDSERSDLLRATVVGRHAPSAAAVAVVSLVNLVLAAVCAVAFVALDYPMTGSIALAGSFLAVGLVFVGVTAVAAQVASTSRATLGLASAVLVAMFLLRAIGDIGDSALRWMSPIGWAQSVRAFAGEQWWPLALCLVLAAGLVVLAFWLSTQRDAGSGLIPARPGPARASAGLVRPFGLAVRLHRNAVIAWGVGLLVIGVVYGSIGESVDEMIEENPVFADMLATVEGADLTQAYFATSMLLLAVLASGYAISVVLRLRTEEQAGRGELLLAGPLSRRRWAEGHVAVAAVGAAVLMAAAGFGLGATYAAISGHGSEVARQTAAALVTLPGILVMIGVAVALYGLVPQWSLAAWGWLAVVSVVEVFADLLRLPDWVRVISPFDHLPAAPAEAVTPAPLVVLTAVAAALVAAGLWGLRRRDLHAT